VYIVNKTVIIHSYYVRRLWFVSVVTSWFGGAEHSTWSQTGL